MRLGIISATTLYGDGSNLTGVGESIAPHFYNPDINDQEVSVTTGIGITFNKKILAGSGTATVKIVNAGVAGTVHQSWGISSATFNVTQFALGALVSPLTVNETYQVDIPSGFVVDSNETSYVGTAWTFSLQDPVNKLWAWGDASTGRLGQNDSSPERSSPAQIPGTTWKSGWRQGQADTTYNGSAIKDDGTLWFWGYNNHGQFGNNTIITSSSPIQISGTTWSHVSSAGYASAAIKTDGTLWTWGRNDVGTLGQNGGANAHKSSPVQIPGTTWRSVNLGVNSMAATKTDNTLWTWGSNTNGEMGINSQVRYSSPVQVPGTTWTSTIAMGEASTIAIKTDGTLWNWGYNGKGNLAQNNRTSYSSPVQVPGTTWAAISGGKAFVLATKTNGTLWAWGDNGSGKLGQNLPEASHRSSPVQIPGTWGTDELHIRGGRSESVAIKADGTLWSWGYNAQGSLGHNNNIRKSSPVQIGSNTDWHEVGGFVQNAVFAIQKDQTP